LHIIIYQGYIFSPPDAVANCVGITYRPTGIGYDYSQFRPGPSWELNNYSAGPGP